MEEYRRSAWTPDRFRGADWSRRSSTCSSHLSYCSWVSVIGFRSLFLTGHSSPFRFPTHAACSSVVPRSFICSRLSALTLALACLSLCIYSPCALACLGLVWLLLVAFLLSFLILIRLSTEMHYPCCCISVPEHPDMLELLLS